MNIRNNRDQKAALALAIATGRTVRAWAKEHDVPERTAYTWARSDRGPATRSNASDAAAIDRAIGRLSRYAAAAAQQIAKLAEDAESEAVKLQAARAVLADLMTVSNYADLEDRITVLERAQGGSMSRSLAAQARRVGRLERDRGRADRRSPTAPPGTGTPTPAPAGCPPATAATHPRARAAQRPPEGDWRTWLLLGGRAAGKTRTAAELVRHWAESGQARRIGLIAATAADYRDTMIQGPSGILTIAPPWNRPRFEPSKRRLTWPNGAIAICLSADQPERARGLQFDRLWCDELCAWPYPQRMWEIVLLCLRLGQQPRAVVTTTPKPIKLLAADPRRPDDPALQGDHLRQRPAPGPRVHLRDHRHVRGHPARASRSSRPRSSTPRRPSASRASARPGTSWSRAEYVPGLPVRLAIDCGLSPARRRPVVPGPRARRRDAGQRPPDHQRLRRLLRRRQDLRRQRPGHPRAVAPGLRRPPRSRLPRPGLARPGAASGRRPAASSPASWASGSPTTGRRTACSRASTRSRSSWAHRPASRTSGSTRGASSSSRASRPTAGPSSRARSSTRRPTPSTPPRRPSTRSAAPSGRVFPEGRIEPAAGLRAFNIKTGRLNP